MGHIIQFNYRKHFDSKISQEIFNGSRKKAWRFRAMNETIEKNLIFNWNLDIVYFTRMKKKLENFRCLRSFFRFQQVLRTQ